MQTSAQPVVVKTLMYTNTHTHTHTIARAPNDMHVTEQFPAYCAKTHMYTQLHTYSQKYTYRTIPSLSYTHTHTHTKACIQNSALVVLK